MTTTFQPDDQADVLPADTIAGPPTETAAESPNDAGDGVEVDQEATRLAVSISFPVVGAAIMTGGVFLGVTPRIYGAIAGLLGVALGVLASRIKRPVAANLAILGGLFAIGLIIMLPSGPDNIARLRAVVAEASATGNVLRPPVPFSPGWHAILGWLMGLVGFVTAWVAITIRRPSIALLLPLPVAAIGAVSTPQAAQIPSGIVVLVLFAIGLGTLASSQSLGEGEERPPVAYEVRKALKSLPLLAVITVLLVVLAQADFLFPKPYIDPTQEAQRPRTVPLSEVEDRVLFSVESSISGPWRIGSLDVYDGEDWRLPPFAENLLNEIPRSGIVNDELKAGVTARFFVAGLGGAVLPTLPNTVGVVAEGPELAYDDRNGNIRVAQGQIRAGLSYAVTAAALPSVEDLQAVTVPLPAEVRRFTEIPIDPPPSAQALIDDARTQGSRWDQFDYTRTWILDNVVASGPGAPKSIDAEIVQDMIGGSREASPFEIVAAQAMFARWLGLPSRIGYGFDGGELIDGRLQVRPRNGASFVEVFFPGYGWLPVIGTPKQAKPTVGGDPGQQQVDPTILPSEDVSVQLFLPVVVPPGSILLAQIRQTVLIVVPILVLLAAAYVLWPAAYKARRRSKRRAAAAAAGSRARVALAYAEFRDYATDYGFRFPTDTPLMFLDRFIDDPDHVEFAWLVTRCLWGDLQHDIGPDIAASAEELSRSLRSRLAQAQPSTVRAVALVSRLSLRHPYAPETDLTRKKGKADDALAA
jgi:hypothetical protein